MNPAFESSQLTLLPIPHGRLFDSEEVMMISGVSPDKQRQWRARAIIPWDTGVDVQRKGRAVLTPWRDVMKWALVGHTLKYGLDVSCSAHFANAECLEKLAHVDLRRESGAPLYAFCRPLPGDAESYGRVSTGAGKLDFNDGSFWGDLFFAVNYSEVQRSAMKRFETL